MKIIDLNEEQAEDIETRLSAFDENYITYKMDGCIQIGIEDNGKLIAGLDASAYRWLKNAVQNESGSEKTIQKSNLFNLI